MTNLGTYGLSLNSEESLQKYLKLEKSLARQKSYPNIYTPMKIHMVDNNNQKVMVDLITPDMTINQKNIKSVPNPFNRKLRRFFFENSQFYKNYTSNYEPIYLQERNQEKPDAPGEDPSDRLPSDAHKKHFIKTKHTQANMRLKRTYGVSYIKPTESHQENVTGIYAP